MKNAEGNKHFLSLLIILGVVLLFTACSKVDNSYARINPTIPPRDTTPNPQNQVGTIADEIFGDSAEYGILKNIIIRSGTEGLLRTMGPFTFFAPKDWTFEGSGIDLQTIPGIPVDSLKKIILFLLVDGSKSAFDLQYNFIHKLISKGGDSLFVNQRRGIDVNGSMVETVDRIVSNGIVHRVLGTLMPPAGDIMQTLKVDTSCSYFVAALLRASTGAINLVSELGKNIYTILAPNNQAFHAAGFNSMHDLESISPDSLSSILLFHIIPGRLYTADWLYSSYFFETLNKKNLQICYLDPDAPPDPKGFQLSVKGNPYYPEASFSKINKIATNGVVHVIDQVMIP
jgi:uncharacterized surface protein with fasciclin (FAS1) repeats